MAQEVEMAQTLQELDLPHLPMEEPGFAENPYPYFEAARRCHPWLATSNFGLIVHEYSAIRELFRKEEQLRPCFDGIVEQLEAKGTPWGRFTEEQMIAMPEDEHRLVRDIFA